MDLHYSPSEIEEKDFSKSLAGYKKSEVNLFLHEVAEQTETLKKQISKLQDKIETQNKELEKVEEQKMLLQRTLVLAEKLKDETLANAKSEAENIIKDAEISSREKVQKAKDYLSILEHELINLKEKKLQFTSHLKTQLKTMLENMERFEEEKKFDFADTKSTPKEKTKDKYQPEKDGDSSEQETNSDSTNNILQDENNKLDNDTEKKF